MRPSSAVRTALSAAGYVHRGFLRPSSLPVAKLTSRQGVHKKTHVAASEHPLLQSLKDLVKPTPYPTDPATGIYNPFPKYQFAGPLRPAYPLSPFRPVLDTIKKPDYAIDGIPRSEIAANRFRTVKVLDEAGMEAMRTVCRLGREVLDIAAAAAKPGVTTDEIDRIVHEACMERDVSFEPARSSGESPWWGNQANSGATNSATPPPSTTTTSPNPSAPPSTKSSATASPTRAPSKTAISSTSTFLSTTTATTVT